jgi:hypothetical protein
MANDGFNAIARRMVALGTEVPSGIGRALRTVGENIVKDVQNYGPGRGVPYRTGKLSRSGRVEGPETDVKQTVTVAFGGGEAFYGLIVHENPSAQHPVGEARYLVRGMERVATEGKTATKEALQAELDIALARVGAL